MINWIRAGRLWLRNDAPDAVVDIIVIIAGAAVLNIIGGVIWGVLKGLF